MSESKQRPMFRLQPAAAAVQWPAIITVPTAEGPQEMQFTAKFVLLEEEEARQVSAKGDRQFVKRVLIGWGDDVQAEDGTPLDFSPVALDALCDKPWFRRGVINAYYLCAAGIVEKN